MLLFPYQSCLQPLFCTLRLRHAPLLLAAGLPQGHTRTAEQNRRLRAGLPTFSPAPRLSSVTAGCVCFCTEHTSPRTGTAPTCPHPTAPHSWNPHPTVPHGLEMKVTSSWTPVSSPDCCWLCPACSYANWLPQSLSICADKPSPVPVPFPLELAPPFLFPDCLQ